MKDKNTEFTTSQATIASLTDAQMTSLIASVNASIRRQLRPGAYDAIDDIRQATLLAMWKADIKTPLTTYHMIIAYAKCVAGRLAQKYNQKYVAHLKTHISYEEWASDHLAEDND